MAKRFNYTALALKIYKAIREKGYNFVSWEEIGRPFQDPYTMDMRNCGFVALSGNLGESGICLRDKWCATLSISQFLEYFKQFNL